MGVFLQPDPIGFKGDAANLYRFCSNNPVNRTDPDGLWDMWGNLKSFFSGNPAMNIILNAWSDRQRGDLAAPGGGEAKRTDARNQSSAPGSSAVQNQPGVPDHLIREQTGKHRPYRDEDGIYWAEMSWKITLYDRNNKHVGRGVYVDEKITWEENVGMTAKAYDKGAGPTRNNGSVSDTWRLPFNRPDGHVKVIQTVIAGGRTATLGVTVHANGETENRDYYAPFH
jgi:hypothetical protein